MEQPEQHIEWIWPCECWSARQRADHSFRKSPGRVLLPSCYWNSRSGFCLWVFLDKCDPKEIKKGNIFPGYSSGRSHHPGLVGAVSLPSFWAGEHGNSSFSDYACNLQIPATPDFKLAPKLLPGTETKRIALHGLLKEINDRLLLFCPAINNWKYFVWDTWEPAVVLWVCAGPPSTWTKVEYEGWDITSCNRQQFCLRLPLWRTVNAKDQWWGTSSQKNSEPFSLTTLWSYWGNHKIKLPAFLLSTEEDISKEIVLGNSFLSFKIKWVIVQLGGWKKTLIWDPYTVKLNS